MLSPWYACLLREREGIFFPADFWRFSAVRVPLRRQAPIFYRDDPAGACSSLEFYMLCHGGPPPCLPSTFWKGYEIFLFLLVSWAALLLVLDDFSCIFGVAFGFAFFLNSKSGLGPCSFSKFIAGTASPPKIWTFILFFMVRRIYSRLDRPLLAYFYEVFLPYPFGSGTTLFPSCAVRFSLRSKS